MTWVMRNILGVLNLQTWHHILITYQILHMHHLCCGLRPHTWHAILRDRFHGLRKWFFAPNYSLIPKKHIKSFEPWNHHHIKLEAKDDVLWACVMPQVRKHAMWAPHKYMLWPSSFPFIPKPWHGHQNLPWYVISQNDGHISLKC